MAARPVVDFRQFQPAFRRGTAMGPLDALNHLANFFLPALGLALWASLLAKLAWRRELKGVALTRLIAWSTAAGAAVLIAGLVVFGHDGKMATYGGMVLASSLALWWAGWRGR
jgi:hypothetical protein